MTDAAAAPLSGLRVLDLSRLVAGNMVTHLLADFGAEVVKIEPPKGGDDLRAWKVKGISTYWKVYARNKKSVTLDLRSDEGRALLGRLAATADVLVENFKPGTMEKMGLGPAELLAANPGLVMLRVSGWGQDGPFRHKPGFGTLVESMSGFAAMNGFPDRPPVLPPLALADMIAGIYGAFAAVVAVRARERGQAPGQVIDLPLFDPIFSILGPHAANYALSGEVYPRVGSRTLVTAPRNVYPTADGGYVALSASMQAMVERLFHTIGMPELIDDPRFRTNTDRVANIEALDEIVGGWIAARTQAENLAAFEAAGVTVGPICDIADLMDHPFIKERAIIVDVPDEEAGSLPMHGVTPRLSATPGSIRTPAPALGEHTAQYLGEIGLGAEAVAELRARGVV
ncbi:MAG: CoA transferase [Thalassobaculales bacterium]